MQKVREKSLETKSEAPPHPLYGNVDIPLYLRKKSQKRSQTYHRFVLRFSKVQNE